MISSRLRQVFCLLGVCFAAHFAVSATPAEEFETKIANLTAQPRVTIVHFWAPWCSNCRAELKSGGWKDFAIANPDVEVVFITIWNSEDGRGELAKYGLTELENVQLFHHPNTARSQADRVSRFLDQPVSWIPSTWIYRAGKLRYALNYGEVRFPLLQQLVRDASAKW